MQENNSSTKIRRVIFTVIPLEEVVLYYYNVEYLIHPPVGSTLGINSTSVGFLLIKYDYAIKTSTLPVYSTTVDKD